jgi:type I restriction enzyme M protein
MNLLLHGIGAPEADSPIRVDDSLKADPGMRFEMVLTNPPFGKKSSITVINVEGESEREDLVVVRDDFWASTSNKQLNFVQHVKTLLQMNGRAAVVVPDNVLSSRAGPGRPSAGSCSMSAMSTRCCGSQPASSTPKA